MRKDILVILGIVLIIFIIGYSFSRQGKARREMQNAANVAGPADTQSPATSAHKNTSQEGVRSSASGVRPKERKVKPYATEGQPQRALREVAFTSGFAWGNLKEQDHYEVIPLMVSLGFDLKPILAKIGLYTKGLFNINVEPFLGYVISPNNNAELGCSFLLKFAYPLTKKIRPYIEGGSGLIYLTQHTREQSTQFNFVDQGGVGLSYLFKDNLSLNVGYRFRHISNASIKEPNSGINSDMILCGVSVLY